MNGGCILDNGTDWDQCSDAAQHASLIQAHHAAQHASLVQARYVAQRASLVPARRAAAFAVDDAP